MITTLQEAIDLENKVDKLFSDALNCEANVSMALTGRMKINYRENYLSLDRTNLSISYLNYHGHYSDLLDEYEAIIEVINANKTDIDLLIESYDNKSQLKE